MRCLLLAEGNARTFDSWSGISQRVVSGLEKGGHTVVDVNCDLDGMTRYLAAALSWALARKRWWVRYHLGPRGFSLRSRRAAAAVKNYRDEVDYVLQFGATFDPGDLQGLPLFLYCDGNAALSTAGIDGGQSEASFLSVEEIEDVKKRESCVYQKARRIFTFSDRLRRSFISDFSLDTGAVTTIFAGANLDAESVSFDQAHRRMHFPTVLFVGRDFQRKGGDILLSAFARIRKNIPSAELLIVGCSPKVPGDSGITVFGNIDRDDPQGEALIRSLFSRASIFCMPTRFEGLSISFLEAMCFSLPCLGASSEWSPAEMIVDGVTGFTVAVDDVGALTDRLMTLCLDPVLATAMGTAGRKRALDSFTWDAVVSKMVQGIEGDLGHSQ